MNDFGDTANHHALVESSSIWHYGVRVHNMSRILVVIDV